MSTIEPPFRWRSIALPALLPTLLFSIGEGAIIPIIPIAANNLGATLAIAGLVAGILTIGELFGNIPSGWLIARVGERPAMIGASVLSVIGLVICVIAPNPVALGFGVLLVGVATAVFALARHAFMTSFVPIAYRARALATLGGTFRLGYFIGPFLSAIIIHLTGTASSAFWIHLFFCVATAVILITLPDPTATFGAVRTVRLAGRNMREGEALVELESAGLFQTIYRKRAVLTRLGVGAALIGALRASRQVVLPLWAVSIGISEPNTAVIIGIAGAVDFALFYASGQIMDRFGRLWSALPSMIGLGLGHLALAFTHDLSSNVSWFIGVAMFLSLANGIGSGILMTLGADLADKDNPAPFLGAWRFTGNLGGAAAPLIVAGITAVASLSFAAATLGVLGLLGAGVIARYLPRFSPHAGRGAAGPKA
ncbi:MFS transporter [Salinibacterium sp. G-O1]|uniref:MFS transporter n=1 Tax=Salinibacterium sp. G-O1 TaxID=3046208 RepID=UPI0024B9AD98|nr:MFS transporter [Salinibacterium sp. G-O1]MDJ0334581.1 MFS transporter [Salinibacterium sp. G-O1]